MQGSEDVFSKVKRRVFEIIQTATEGDTASKVFDIGIIILIIVNTIMVIADTFDLPDLFKIISRYIENVSVIIFTIEYLLRVWTADYIRPNVSPVYARIRYIVSFMALIDLLAILPFYLPMLIPIDLRVLRTLRIVRLFRLFKINRYTTALNTIGKVFKNKASELISSMSIVLLLMIISSVIMYNVEHEAQPEQFNNAFQSMWWAVATLTTVGYGDIYPVTAVGKLLSAFISVLGIGLVAVPTGIITAGFAELVSHNHEEDEKHFCPYCGHKL